MDYTTLRVPTPLYERIRDRADTERRNVSQMARVLLEDALELGVPAERWVEPAPPIPEPSRAEKEFATEDPVEPPEIEPEDLMPIFEPITVVLRGDEVKSDFVQKKMKR